MKALKLIGKIILGIVAFVLLVILALPLWIGPVVCGVANAVAPGITKTDFHLGKFGLNPYTGRLVVGDLQLANPTNFSEKNAVDLTRLEVNVAMSSVFAKKIRIEYVELDGLTVWSALDGGNFIQIAKNAQGEPKVEEPAEASAETPAAKNGQVAENAPAEEQPTEPQQKKGVQIDRVTLKNVIVKYGPVPVPVALELHDIGKDSEYGAGLIEVWNDIFGAVMRKVGAIGDKVGELGKGLLDAGSDGLKGLHGAVKGVDAGKALDDAADSLKDAGKALKGLFK